MKTIIGIDPGSRVTGYGVIRSDGNQHIYLASGCINCRQTELATKLQSIYIGITEIIHRFNPNQAAIEQIFVAQNSGAALKLGQARGVAIVAMAVQGLTVAEYSARSIKQAVAGYGAAEKTQVQHMVKLLLNLHGTPQVDAADALAVAICHAHSNNSLSQKLLEA